MSIYQFEMEKMDGTKQTLDAYQGKVLLIVNTASKCGFTKQFEGLENLFQKYQSEGFVILGFPCNQFLNQDPKSNEEILTFCQLNYGVTFPMFSKIKVRGKEKNPLYDYLIQKTDNKKIEWNFTKFLIDRKGEIIGRFSPKTTPEMLDSEIRRSLQ